MPDAPYIPSSRLEKVPPSASSWLTWWAADAMVAGVCFVGTLVCSLAVLSIWALHPGANALSAQLDEWAVWTGVGLGFASAVLAVSLGKDHRSLGQNLAEVKCEDMSGRPAPWGRRALRVAMLFAVLLGLAMVQWLLAFVGAAGMVAFGLLSQDRRDPFTRLAGLRDYQTDLVRVPSERAAGSS
jgi:hypothetical protein